MTTHIHEEIRLGVIQYWLRGKSRDDIARKFNNSGGGVTNIIKAWRNQLGMFEADNLRELSLSLQKAGISPMECSEGLELQR